MKNFLDLISDKIVVFDGAMGSMLQQMRVDTGTLPEKLVLTSPEVFAGIHRAYAAAGADVISTATFGANAAKAGELSDGIISAAVKLARDSAPGKLIALDLGPTGQMLEPLGTMTFDQAYDVYRRAVVAGKDADLVLVETMSDLAELRAALLAVRENSSLPVVASMTFFDNMRTFTGCDVTSFVLTAAPLADAIGVNCSLGPDQLLPIVEKIASLTSKPIIVQPNAGLPDEEGNYSVGAEEFAAYCSKYVDLGVAIIGGCCGTTPEHIKLLRKIADRGVRRQSSAKPVSAVCSARRAVTFDAVRVIGERINPTGKKAMKEALRSGDYDYISRQAIEQEEAGADVLDVNAGLPDIDEKAALVHMVTLLQRVTDLPLQIDCTKPDAIEAALRAYHGKAIVNSVSGDDDSLDGILPVAAKYGAAIVALCVDKNGVPETVEDRLRIARKIISAAKKYGIPEQDIFVDCLTLTVGAQQEQAVRTLEAIRRIKSEYDVRTVLGVSNISFGLPERKAINTAFLSAALWAGLDAPILNPNIPENMQAVAAFKALCGEDVNCAAYTAKYSAAPKAEASPSDENQADLAYLIRKGLPTAQAKAAAMLDGGIAPLELVNFHLIPALNSVGDDYEKGTLFLPQLIAAADAAKLCFDEIKKRMPESSVKGDTIVLATVEGDVHDIGKNIVKTVLANYGYDVVDLGKNVRCETVAEEVKRRGAKLCGLSALMTTTVPNMQRTIELLRRDCPDCSIMVGGAVLTEDYARKIGADYYCKDAAADVRIAAHIFKGEPLDLPRLRG